MFKHLLTTGFLTVSLFAAAQTIPNAGYEDWADSGLGYEDPEGWVTLNIFSLLGGEVSVTESSDAHSGSSAAAITTTMFDADEDGTPEPFPGILALGSLESVGMPTTNRPDSLIVWAKYTPSGADEFTVTIDLSNNGMPVGGGTFTGVTAGSGYVRLAIGIDYASSDTPDTLNIGFTSSASDPQIGSELLVDDVSLVTNPTTSVAEIKQQAPLSLYPNPARESLNIQVGKDATIEIYNALGMLVETIKADSDKPYVLSTADYRSGVYLAKSSNGVTQRFVVKH